MIHIHIHIHVHIDIDIDTDIDIHIHIITREEAQRQGTKKWPHQHPTPNDRAQPMTQPLRAVGQRKRRRKKRR